MPNLDPWINQQSGINKDEEEFTPSSKFEKIAVLKEESIVNILLQSI
jgi:hypothetical protein